MKISFATLGHPSFLQIQDVRRAEIHGAGDDRAWCREAEPNDRCDCAGSPVYIARLSMGICLSEMRYQGRPGSSLVSCPAPPVIRERVACGVCWSPKRGSLALVLAAQQDLRRGTHHGLASWWCCRMPSCSHELNLTCRRFVPHRRTSSTYLGGFSSGSACTCAQAQASNQDAVDVRNAICHRKTHARNYDVWLAVPVFGT